PLHPRVSSVPYTTLFRSRRLFAHGLSSLSWCPALALAGEHGLGGRDGGAFADRRQRPPQCGAGGVHGVREVLNFDADLGELFLKPEALRGSAPVISLEKVGESDLT